MADIVLDSNAEALRLLAAKLERLCALAHSRLTVRQAVFFLVVVHHRALGQAVTMTDLLGRYGLGRSITKSKAMLMEPSPEEPQALGWLRQEVDPADGRQRYLDLTPRGWSVAASLGEAGRALTIGMILRRLREDRTAP